MYKLTFYSLKIGPKNRPRLIHGSKTKIKRSSGQFFFCNYSVSERKFQNKREVFHENSYPEIRKNYFLVPKMGVDLYTGKCGNEVGRRGKTTGILT